MTDAPSWWWADLGGLPAPRPALDGDREADVCIVGAGYTGLWTAYELLRADPSLDVVVLEARGGRLRRLRPQRRLGARARSPPGRASARRPGARVERARARDPGDRRRGRRGLRARGHRLRLRQGRLADRRPDRAAARAPARRAAGRVARRRRVRPRARCASPALRGARFTPHCARVQPAKLARGLAEAVERHGGTIHEGTAALDDRAAQRADRLGHGARALGRARHRGLHRGPARPASARCCRCRAR